jgi:hypothetical protein
MNRSKKTLFLSAFFVAALLPGVAAASTVYTVTANTSSISGQDGFLDLQFEPGPAATNLATATVTGFTTNGTLTGAATLTGDVTGQLPATLNFDSQTVFNDYFQETTFGSLETFTITLSGPTPAGGGPSAFNIGFYAADGSTPLLTDSPDGNAGQITLNADGTTSVQTFPTVNGGQPVLTIASAVAVVPEPASLGLVGLSMGFAIFWIGRSQRRR